MYTQPQLCGYYTETFEEAFLLAFAIIRVCSDWICDSLDSSSIEPLKTRLEKKNIQSWVYPGDTEVDGASGEWGRF